MTNTLEKSGRPTVDVVKILSQADLQQAMKIRCEVFVLEQNVPAEEEIDEFENQSVHFLAFLNNIPCGVARWRFTEKGIKLERFAVIKKYRGVGVGGSLVEAVLKDVYSSSETKHKQLYLSAQLVAVNFYSKFGFVKTGHIFQECKIDHIKMVKE